MRVMVSFLRIGWLGILIMAWLFPLAQNSVGYGNLKADIKRQLFHDYLDNEQKAALSADGKANAHFTSGNNDDINYLITRSLVQNVDALQYSIEHDTVMNHIKKVTYLRGLENMLKKFTDGVASHKFTASHWPQVMVAYESAIEADTKNRSVEPVVTNAAYDVAKMLIDSKAFESNKGFQNAQYAVMRKYAQIHPERIFYMLKQNPEIPFRDSLVLVAAYKYPRQLYDYAAANNKLGYLIRKIDDPLVKVVSKMATSGGSGQFYFPFLDNILKGKQTIEEIDAVKNDNVKYFKLLVKTRIDYVMRQMNKDTIYEMKGLNDQLERKARDIFIKTINGLHEESDAVRFRILHQLSAQELYYVIVSGESEIYTSSYTRGAYPIMMSKIANHGDTLLMSVGFDRFKKFIKMAAGYNTLNDFLKTFSDADAQTLMTAFVNGLEKSSGLEDGVDVADSYVSIAEHNKPLASYILNLTKSNFEKSLAVNNQRGAVMYNLLYKLFLSADTSANIDLSKEFGIAPVYQVGHDALANSKNEIIMQVFFYGDEDGMNIFQGFLRQFSGPNWKVTYSKQWVSIASTKGNPVLIYANKPLPEETGEDEKAQNALSDYLEEVNQQPTVIIHRGHSYYASATISHILPSAKIVFLGSCGGYHLIHDVLGHAPDAHIIASKQIGKTVINQPFFNLLMEKLRNGSNIDWIPFWSEFRRNVSDKDGFEDYIPPHKNLGAIFIKAYKSAMGEDEVEVDE